MKSKPAMWAVAAAPLLLLLGLAGTMRGVAYLQGAAQAAAPAAQDTRPTVPMPLPVNADKATAEAAKKAAGGQIAALQKRDFKTALRFAEPPMQKQWKPEAFGTMIIQGYKELIDAKTVSFGQAQTAQGGSIVLLPVTVKNAQNQETPFLYILSRPREKSGAWHVSGCQRKNPPALPPAPLRLDTA